MIHDKLLIAFGDESFKFLTSELSMVGYWPTMAVTGNRELGFDSGEGLRNGYHVKGRQQARKLPNPDTGR